MEDYFLAGFCISLFFLTYFFGRLGYEKFLNQKSFYTCWKDFCCISRLVSSVFARYSIAAASSSSSRVESSERLPSIEEFRTWRPKQVVGFFELYLRWFSKDQCDLFVTAQFDGEVMATMSH